MSLCVSKNRLANWIIGYIVAHKLLMNIIIRRIFNSRNFFQNNRFFFLHLYFIKLRMKNHIFQNDHCVFRMFT